MTRFSRRQTSFWFPLSASCTGKSPNATEFITNNVMQPVMFLLMRRVTKNKWILNWSLAGWSPGRRSSWNKLRVFCTNKDTCRIHKKVLNSLSQTVHHNQWGSSLCNTLKKHAFFKRSLAGWSPCAFEGNSLSVFISRTMFENHKMTLLTRRQTHQEFTNRAKSEIVCQKPCFPSCRIPPDARSHGKQAIFQKESGACVAATCLGNKFLSFFHHWV